MSFAKVCFLFLGWMVVGHDLCPIECNCSLDERGRRQVLCWKGGLTDPIPVASMERDVEVFKISAPLDSPNFLTIGPIFQQFSHLEELHIVRSNVPAIGRHSFWGVPTLQILNLTQNNISHVLEHNFRGLVNLVKLHLDENRIESMPSETFRHLQELRVLTLARNRIRELVPRIFLMLGKLRELDLSRNPLGELNPEVFKDVQSLRVFRCRSCRLSNVNALVYRLLADLVELDLGDNEFKYIRPEEFLFMRKLQVLRLDENQLAVVMDDTFGASSRSGSNARERTNLRVIDLSRNRLAKITLDAFADLTTLRVLDLSYNKFDRMESKTFLPIGASLRVLNLSGNAVPTTELGFIVQAASNLSHLSLADMELTEPPSALFSGREHLKFLNLSGNRFSHLSPNFVGSMPRVQTLDLSRNRFRGLTEKVLTRLEKIPNLILTENPWACDLCHVPPILNRVRKPESGLALSRLTCKSPYALAGRLVASLQGDELAWCSAGDAASDDENAGAVGAPTNRFPGRARTGLVIALITLTAFVAFGVAALACVAYSRRRTSHYYTREDRRRQTEVENGKGKFVGPTEVAAATKKKKVTIATIEEIVAKSPEFRSVSNDT